MEKHSVQKREDSTGQDDGDVMYLEEKRKKAGEDTEEMEKHSVQKREDSTGQDDGDVM